MNEVLHLLTGYRSLDDSLMIKKFDGASGTLEDWVVKVDSSCPTCESNVAVGDTVWVDLSA